VTLDDRLALILGRAIIRAEALTVELEQAQARIAELEQPEDPVTSVPSPTIRA